MRWYYKLPLRLRSLFRKYKTELDLSEELQFHLQNQIDENVAQGMDPQEARRAALRSLGGVEQVKEECRDARKTDLIENFLRDMRLGLRMLRRNPGFTVLTILCLTLGIGANAAVFSWVEGILLRPYPLVTHQERLVALDGPVGDERDETSWPDLLDIQRSCTLCETLFISNITGATLSIGDRAQVMTGSIVSANYFDAIGVHPILGRGFAPGEDIGRNAHPIVVISYHLWQITSCTPSSGSRPRGSMALSLAGAWSIGCLPRWWKLSTAAATNWKIAARDGVKRMCDSNLA